MIGDHNPHIEARSAIDLSQTLPEAIDTKYSTYGTQTLIAYLFRNGVTFTQIEHVYEIIVGVPVSNGTIGNTLKRVLRKRIIVESRNLRYAANIIDLALCLVESIYIVSDFKLT